MENTHPKPPPSPSRLPRLAQRPEPRSPQHLRSATSLNNLRSNVASSPGVRSFCKVGTVLPPSLNGPTARMRGDTTPKVEVTNPSVQTRKASSIRATEPQAASIRRQPELSLRKAVSTSNLKKSSLTVATSTSSIPRNPSRLRSTDDVQTDMQSVVRPEPSPESSRVVPKSPSTPRSTLRAQIAAKRREFQQQQRRAASSAGGSDRLLDADEDHKTAPMISGRLMDQTGLQDMFAEMELASDSLSRIKANSVRSCRQEPSEDAVDDLFGRSLSDSLVKALRTGKLDVANMDLEVFPRELWTGVLGLSEAEVGVDVSKVSQAENRSDPFASNFVGDEYSLPPHVASAHSSTLLKKKLDEVPFYEREDLSVIRASGNLLKSIEPWIGMFGALRALDVSFQDGGRFFCRLIDHRIAEIEPAGGATQEYYRPTGIGNSGPFVSDAPFL